MGWFDDFKAKLTSITVSPAGGEWAAVAMACMVFADGEASQSEIDSAMTSCTNNPVILSSIGENKAQRVFNGTIEVLKVVPQTMLASYEDKLQTLGKVIKKQEDKNFAYATVLAVALADGELTNAEQEMLVRFKSYIQANVDVPEVDS
ncbi:MAG: tellurite resistance TerB family protein, partial [Planctomycetota bacterium]|nr:tellurite resistance TerB family protein [Planctomycetota bacterium]